MSGDADSGQEKSFEASQSKLDEARKQGDIAQSPEVGSLMVYCGLAISILIFGGVISRAFLKDLSALLTYPEAMGDAALHSDTGRALVFDLAISCAPFIICLTFAVCAGLAVQRSVTFAPKRIEPKLSKISPLSNAKQKYGRDGMAEFAKRAVKLGIVTITAIFYLIRLIGEVAYEIGRPEAYLFPKLASETLLLLACIIVASLVITAVDLPFVQWSHKFKQRMTREEVKDEQKKSEGDPLMKSQRRARAREIANSTMLTDVKTASVVIVNPTHYAVALSWDRETGAAPVCVAKGVDHLAFAIREAAREADVIIHSDPPTARAIHATVEIGGTIKPEHYAAVASAIHLAQVLSQKGKYT
jgi:flagellar biosynthetic protein FlhB